MADTLPFPAPMPSADPTVREVIGFYLRLEAKIETRCTKRAWEERERILRAFAAVHGELHISECKKAHLIVWIEGNPRLKSEWTKGRWCRTVQSAFNWACDKTDLIAKNPFKGVRYKKGKRGRPLTDAEFAGLVAAAGKVFEPVLCFCRFTGARPGEMAAATWADVHGSLESGRAWIILREHKTSHVEDAKPRVIGLGPAACQLLLDIRRSLNCLPGLEPEHVFNNSRGKPWTRNAINLRFANLRKRLNLPADAKLYGTRHAYATHAIKTLRDIRGVSRLLGHQGTAMTEHYLHDDPDGLEVAELAANATAGLEKPGAQPGRMENAPRVPETMISCAPRCLDAPTRHASEPDLFAGLG